VIVACRSIGDFGLGWGELAVLAVEAAMVVPVDVFGYGDPDIVDRLANRGHEREGYGSIRP
jgi:hypothetical protein